MRGFESVMARFASLPDASLDGVSRWRGGDLPVREALYRSLEREQEALVRARAPWSPTEAEAILALAQRALGDLRGLVVALPDEVLDRAPGPGEWPLRAVLGHVIWIERRYAVHTAYAAHRRDDEPLRVPEDRLPRQEDVDASGSVERLLDRLAAARDRSDALLGALPAEAMTRPSEWSGHRIDVRYRLHRFASHLVEHTVQCEKTLDALGVRQGEARRVVRRIWATRGELEASAEADVLAALDAEHAERAEAVAGLG